MRASTQYSNTQKRQSEAAERTTAFRSTRYRSRSSYLKHADLVKRIAYHLVSRMPPNVEVDDLIQSGMIGLAGRRKALFGQPKARISRPMRAYASAGRCSTRCASPIGRRARCIETCARWRMSSARSRTRKGGTDANPSDSNTFIVAQPYCYYFQSIKVMLFYLLKSPFQ